MCDEKLEKLIDRNKKEFKERFKLITDMTQNEPFKDHNMVDAVFSEHSLLVKWCTIGEKTNLQAVLVPTRGQQESHVRRTNLLCG